MKSVPLRVLLLPLILVFTAVIVWIAWPTSSTTSQPAALLGATGHAWDVVFRDPDWFSSRTLETMGPWTRVMLYMLYGIVGLICIYSVRHYLFTFNRLLGRQRHPYLPIDEASWPHLTVVVPCHNEEAVVETILSALIQADYPTDRLRIIPINDRSTDRTQELIEQWEQAYPGRIDSLHRTDGKPGKAAALKDAIAFIQDDIMLVFDADYVPGRDLIKRLAAPFLDPEVGAVMGRVVPVNTERNLLTRMLDMERAGGYQVDQQARMNLGLIPQYGGTVGGVRMTALREVGGWRDDALSEDTDITCRLAMGGWKIAYSNRYECYEEVPESWPVRIRQITRWARGHTDAALRYTLGIVRSPHLRLRERIDGVLLLGTYMMSPILLIGWILALAVFYLGANPLLGAVAVLSVASYNTIGNFAAFYEIGTAVRLDGTPGRLKLLPLVLSGFLVSLVTTSRAVFTQIRVRRSTEHPVWDKTKRYRTAGDPMVRQPARRDRPSIPHAVPLPVAEPETVAFVAPEPVDMPEPVDILELVVAAEPVSTPMPVDAFDPVDAPDPVDTPEPVAPPPAASRRSHVKSLYRAADRGPQPTVRSAPPVKRDKPEESE